MMFPQQECVADIPEALGQPNIVSRMRGISATLRLQGYHKALVTTNSCNLLYVSKNAVPTNDLTADRVLSQGMGPNRSVSLTLVISGC
jgi:hypothetical protein